ncbi:iron complex transport system substrate-binding protein [Microbacterium endophyticum]|uniref:Iron complex transport system substrate-binding protein n=1 Tax=Microbacterium endophyticum TaxID=1526412 RepID=A0A7W4YMJ5_9MICO|nr:ABC transporter substrate-binding protein [Microbacterium endophyticum]MBB2975549.1 iron complex transport system substrate-binding protein [Microbacterium endophyticum]NIK35432.1 iron complex transport system substrate-binding protein [Microbacterium endophyticum]
MMTPARPWAALALATGAVLMLAGCSTAADASGSSSASAAITLDNCGSQVTLDGPAKRIVLVNNDALADIEALDAIDRVVAVTSTPQEGLYDDTTYTALANLDVLSTEKNATGGSVVSQEAIIGADPDLVIAPENAVDRDALAAAGIALYTPTAYCSDPPPELLETATFDRVWNEITTCGELLGEQDQAADVIAGAKADLASVPSTSVGTAAALYVSSGGTVLSPYGGPSMVTPVFAAAGLENVYADQDERVFDVNIEDVISRDPETIVLLSSAADPNETKDAFLSSPGVDSLSAVKNDRVIVLAFPYTDPPSILSTRGPAVLADALADLS